MNSFWSILFQITIILLKQKCCALDLLLSDGEEEDSKGKLLLVGEILPCKVFYSSKQGGTYIFSPFSSIFGWQLFFLPEDILYVRGTDKEHQWLPDFVSVVIFVDVILVYVGQKAATLGSLAAAVT